MSMKIIRYDVDGIVKKELELTRNIFPPFHSAHEGYAVIREEWNEHLRETTELDELLQCLENAVFTNLKTDKYIDSLELVAIDAACEAIQMAAMCRKFREMKKR